MRRNSSANLGTDFVGHADHVGNDLSVGLLCFAWERHEKTLPKAPDFCN